MVLPTIVCLPTRAIEDLIAVYPRSQELTDQKPLETHNARDVWLDMRSRELEYTVGQS